jgi:hypothetical protein
MAKKRKKKNPGVVSFVAKGKKIVFSAFGKKKR